MSDAPALEPASAAALAAAVQQAFAQASLSGWAPGPRAALWEATLSAVATHLAQAPDDPAARRYYHLLVDLASDATAETIAHWPAAMQRSARLAATRALRHPSKDHHRPRAQALLKRLDLVQNPVLQARERLLLAVARQRQHLAVPRGTGPLVAPAVEVADMILGRITRAARAMPVADGEGPAGQLALIHMRELQALIEAGTYRDSSRFAAIFEAIQRMGAPGRVDLALGPAIAALEAVRLEANPLVRGGRFALLAMAFELDLPAYAPEELPALARHLADLAHVARNLGTIPQAKLAPMLFRLRQWLADPTSETLEERIDEALNVLARVESRRDAALARLVRAEADGAEDVHPARSRVRMLEQLMDTVHTAALAKLGPVEAAGLSRTWGQLEALANEAELGAEALAHAILDVTIALERPAIATNRLWLAGRTAMRQLVAQRRSLDEQARGLALDRHLDEDGRQIRQLDFGRRVLAMDQARLVLGSLQLERVHPAAEADALLVVGAFNQAVRVVAAGGSAQPLKQALDLLVVIGGRLT